MLVSAELQKAQEMLARRRVACSVLRGDSAPTNTPLPRRTGWLSAISNPSPEKQPKTKLPSSTTVMPDIAVAMLRNEAAAAGRIWLLLRANDMSGRGVVSLAQARALLADGGSAQRVVGWRQLRNLFRDGCGIYWDRDSTHIWLRSRTKVAAALGVERFGRDAVSIPTTKLLGTIGVVRAYLYATFHVAGKRGGNAPIARATLQDIAGVSAGSQRNYEMKSGIVAEKQFVVETVSECDEEMVWQHGSAGIKIIDSKGLHGAAGQAVWLRRLPNKYACDFERGLTRLRKRLNRKLVDLLNIRGTGNDWQKVRARYRVNGVRKYGADSAEFYPSGVKGIWYADEPLTPALSRGRGDKKQQLA